MADLHDNLDANALTRPAPAKRPDRAFGLAVCGWGRLGVVTGRKPVTYRDGSSALAFTGRYALQPWRRWSSRQPRWVFKVQFGDAEN